MTAIALTRRSLIIGTLMSACAMGTGCQTYRLDLDQVRRPARSAKLDAMAPLVGQWDWHLDVQGKPGQSQRWEGDAQWQWTLNGRAMASRLSAYGSELDLEIAGLWAWDGGSRSYTWVGVNSWGQPQQGTGTYDDATATWTFHYRGIGLDGDSSFGRWTWRLVDSDRIEWTLEEWADSMYFFPKLTASGALVRRP